MRFRATASGRCYRLKLRRISDGIRSLEPVDVSWAIAADQRGETCRSARPARADVGLPSAMAAVPLTYSHFTPGANWCGLSYVAVSRNVFGSEHDDVGEIAGLQIAALGQMDDVGRQPARAADRLLQR